jgi:transketolase
MAAVCNGLYAHGLYMPFCSTFLVFSGYAYGAMRVSALAHAHVLYIMTHDSVGLGEDGPTHQPVEVLGLMRSTPGMALMRPADAREVAGCYTVAVSRGMAVAGSAGTNASNVKSPDHNNDAIGPITISLSRQSAPLVEGTSPEGATRGAYTLNPEVADPEIVLAGSGTEVALCRAAAASMAPRKVRVVSVPSMEVFAAQGAAYAAEVFPKGVPVLSVEAGHDASWGKLAHAHVGIATFGMSAPGGQVLKEFGFTAENVAAKAAKLIAHFDGKPAPPTCIEL